MSRSLLRTIRRPTSNARQERQTALLTWTCRNQPVRTICAKPRASLRSVLTGIDPIAAFAWRVSRQMAGNPALTNPSCNHAVSVQASRPIRSMTTPNFRKNPTSACGSLPTRASLITLPPSSTMQTAVSSNETSNPA